MPRRPTRRSHFFVAATATAIGLVGASGSVALAQSTVLTQSQKTLLELQLQEHYNCTLSQVLFARELEIGGRKQLEGRIRCVDQREVDFAQAGDNQRFTLQLCMPTVC